MRFLETHRSGELLRRVTGEIADLSQFVATDLQRLVAVVATLTFTMVMLVIYSLVLTLVVTAHGDLPRVLATWDRAPDPFAALHMAALREKVIRATHRTYLHSPYIADHPQAADRIGAFLARPELTQRIETAFFQLDDPRLQKLVSDAIHLS
jgi:ABC-type multidrug transport system fused ATPase/permease subunit